MREYAVIYEKGPASWGAYVPDLPGLVAAGNTLEEVQALIKEGLELHLESMLEDGDPIPDATSLVGTLKTDIVETWSPRLAKSA
jgi:predicted RNase H-like HicB family nuclease